MTTATAVSRSARDDRGRTRMGRAGNATTAGGWAGRGAMAPALLCLLASLTAGCLNPFFFDNVEEPVNHAPVFTNLTPQPSFERLVINVAPNCGPLVTFKADRLDDADFDKLIVRWSLLLEREGTTGGARERLVELELEPCNGLEPCPPEDPGTPIYDFLPFELDRTKVLFALGQAELTAQTDPNGDIEGQLLELRVSDRGFKPNGEDVVEEAGLVFQSWAIKLVQSAEGCG